MPKVYVFETISGDWVVTVKGRGGAPAKFPTRQAAEEWAERRAIVVGADRYTVLTN